MSEWVSGIVLVFFVSEDLLSYMDMGDYVMVICVGFGKLDWSLGIFVSIILK